jgi:hypothetical protein
MTTWTSAGSYTFTFKNDASPRSAHIVWHEMKPKPLPTRVFDIEHSLGRDSVLSTDLYKNPSSYHPRVKVETRKGFNSEDSWLAAVQNAYAGGYGRLYDTEELVSKWLEIVGSSDVVEVILNNTLMQRRRVGKFWRADDAKEEGEEPLLEGFARITSHNLSMTYTSKSITDMLVRAERFVKKHNVTDFDTAAVFMFLHLCFGKKIKGIETWFDIARDGSRIPEIANAIYKGAPGLLVPEVLANGIDPTLFAVMAGTVTR